MKINIGEHTISSDDPNLDRWMHYLHKDMRHEEREELLHEAKHDGAAHFSPKLGVHLVLKRNPDGTHELIKE
jgi:hypothetical protein